MKKLLIEVLCEKETCQTSILCGRGYVKRKPLSNDFYCALFYANLSGEYKNNLDHSYFETKRCELCKKAEYDASL